MAESKEITEIPLNVIEKAVKRIYSQKRRPATVDRELWDAEFRNMDAALRNGYGKEAVKLKFGTPDWEKLQNLRYNTAVFDAFKSNKQIKEAHKLLTDDSGRERTWGEFHEQALKLCDKYNVRWLQAEYNQAHTSAKAARKWLDYEKEADLYPNLEYVAVMDERTRSSHRTLNGIVRPVGDKFWNSHYPPNDWGCRCSVVQTDAKPTAVPRGAVAPDGVFDNNSGKTAKAFDESHPYFQNVTEAEKQRLYYFVEQNIAPAAKVQKAWRDYNAYRGEKLIFDGNSGGYTVANAQRVEHAAISKNEADKYKKEAQMCRTLALNGRKVEMLEEVSGVSSPDVLINGIPAELKRCASANNITNYGKKAMKQGAKLVIFQFDNYTNDFRKSVRILKLAGIKVEYFITGSKDIHF